MGYICPSCGEGLPNDEMCPCLGGNGDLPPGRPAEKRLQDQRRRDKMRANGPIERFTSNEIGERDGWLCGICCDTAHPVDPTQRRPHPLSPSIDHIVPIDGGGTHTRNNVQITHWFCNLEKNAYDSPIPDYAAALLRWRLYGIPVPARLWQKQHQSPRVPRRRQLRVLALVIERDKVAVERWRLILRMQMWRARQEVRHATRDLAQERAVGDQVGLQGRRSHGS
jgi:5-methylcytosine-specific restriction endonuclease McrA